MFTDDDLRQIEKTVSKEVYSFATFTTDQIIRLLRRLNAAEAYICSMPEDVTDDNCRLRKEWLKERGKE